MLGIIYLFTHYLNTECKMLRLSAVNKADTILHQINQIKIIQCAIEVIGALAE